MENLKAAFRLLHDPSVLIAWGGYPVLSLIVFLETGALVFFLPGDSLLVVAGFFAARHQLDLLTLNLLLGPLAILGDACSYQIGRSLGARLHAGAGGRFLKPEHLAAAHAFYVRHGGKAIVMARFVPVVRTFVPVVAGAAAMPYRRFLLFNIFGGLGWVASTTCLGFGLGQKFPWLLEHVEVVILGVVLASLLPLAVHALQARAEARGSTPKSEP